MLYIVSREFVPTSAGTNRLLGWARGFSELGVSTQCIFFAPSVNYDKCQLSLPNVTFKYFWEKFYLKGPYAKFISYVLYVFLFVISLRKGDVVYIYSSLDILKWIVKRKKNVKIFVEITEHPDVSLRGNRFYHPTSRSLVDCCKKTNGLFVISNNLKDYFISKGLDSKNIHVVNMTVDATRFQSSHRISNDRYLVYCGNASSNKKDGVNQLIQAFSITHQKYPDIKLYIIGPKPNTKNPDNNYRLAQNLGLENSIVFVGPIQPKFLPDYLMGSVGCVLDRPDSIQAKYGFPTKVGEYLLSQRPVIVTKVGNIPDFLTDGISALISEPDNIQAFANKMNWCLEHLDLATEIGKNGYKVALQEFNYKLETRKIMDVISQ